MLQALGIPVDVEAVYLELLHHPGLTQGQLAERGGRSGRTLRRSLDHLADLGLISRLAGRPVRFVAARPDAAVEVLISSRQQQFAVARTAARALYASLPAERRHRTDDELELVFGREAVAARFRQLQQSATDEMMVLDRPPYAQDPENPGNDGEVELLRRGVRCRGIYAPEALDYPGALAALHEAIAAGEQARVCEVPLKLAIADRAAAILPLTREPGTMVDSALLVHTSTLLDALIQLFELLWQRAVPMSAGNAAGASTAERQDQQLLTLLAAGLKDEAIARQLGVSLRTVHRRTGDLLERIGARTRFQAGLQAARLGLLPDE